MKLKKILAAAICCGMILTGCRGIGNISSGSSASPPQTQEYSPDGGMYSVTLPAGLEVTSIRMQQNLHMLFLNSTEKGAALQAMILGMGKFIIPAGKSEEIHTLEEYADYMEMLITSNGSVKLTWDSTGNGSMDGMQKCIFKEGKIAQGKAASNACVVYAESESSYYGILLGGKSRELDAARSVLSIRELEPDSAKEKTTKDFIFAMTAILDYFNGSNVLETFKSAEDLLGGLPDSSQQYAGNLEQMKSAAKTALQDSWNVTDRASLYEKKDWLITEGHNKESLSLLTEYGIERETGRDDMLKKLDAAGCTEEEKIYLSAAYDARADFGESALCAWDLSRVPTILGMGYVAGYCTYEEALDGSLEAAKLARQSFGSWEEFNRSYLYGYSYWSEESLDDPDSSAGERKKIADTLTRQADSPFAVNWDMELKNDWAK